MADFFSNISFLKVSGLLGLLSLTIPILIHLFHRSQGKRVIIGNIELIRKAKQAHVTEIKLAQLLLLFVRLSIFTIAALILAEMVFKGLNNRDGEVVYISPAWLSIASIDEIAALKEKHADAQVYVLFNEVAPLNESVRAEVQTHKLADLTTSRTWDLFENEIATVKHTGNISVYAINRQAEFGKYIPLAHKAIDWNIKSITSTPLNTPPANLSIALVQGEGYANDSAVLKHAFDALIEHRNIEITSMLLDELSIASANLENIDWLIWLSSKPFDKALLTNLDGTTRILSFSDSSGDVSALQTATLPMFPFAIFDIQGYQRPPEVGHVLWRTDRGLPLLQSKWVEGIQHYQFMARFQPSSTSLVTLAEFPTVLLEMLLSPNQQASRLASAPISPANFSDNSKTAEGMVSPSSWKPIHRWLALLLTVLWILERWLSERRRHDTL